METGKAEVSKVFNLDSEAGRRAAEQAVSLSAAIAERISPPGQLRGVSGTHPLLEDRRHEFGIPDSAMSVRAVFDRIYVFQVPDAVERSLASGLIVMTDVKKAIELQSTPRGVIVSAGLSALDVMWSHGIELGSVVRLQRLAPFHMRYDVIDMKEQYLLVMRIGDITGCEDGAPLAGPVALDQPDGTKRYVLPGRGRGRKAMPEIAEDY